MCIPFAFATSSRPSQWLVFVTVEMSVETEHVYPMEIYTDSGF